MVLEDGIGVERILVLTFTKAATEELRERIASRLRAALAAVDGAEIADPILEQILRPLDTKIAQVRLAEAVSHMDEAAIHTIHAFCQRLLRDNAFESGISFEPEMIQDESELRRLAAEDLWRRHMAKADSEQAAWMLSNWPNGPAQLLATLGAYIGAAEFEVIPAPDTPPDTPPDAPPTPASDSNAPATHDDPMAPVRAWRERVRSAWPAARDQVLAVVRDSKALNRNSYKAAAIEQIPAAVETLLQAETMPSALPARFDLLTPTKLAKATKKGFETPQHPFFDLCGEMDNALLQSAHRLRRAHFLGDARAQLAEALSQAKEARRVLYFDDLLSHTARVLGGPLQADLAARIRQDYPRALIDEFQDTDPLQYRIFRHVYDGQSACGLFLIGDPKQAIYAFRGADIFTYMAARRHAEQAGNVWSLDTNWRSASALVHAVNTLFERAERPFVYDHDIPFQPVKSGPKADAEPLSIDGSPVIPLELRWLPLAPEHCTKDGRRLSADGALRLAAADCAARLADLLAQAAAGKVRIGDQPLAARDIAVLVRKHKEGVRMREALAQHGIASVSIGNDSVFDTDEAAELALVLAALDEGADEGSIRTALATAMLGWTAARIAALDSDESGWDSLLTRFDDYRQRWRKRGFLAAFWRLMEGEQVAANLRRMPDGERRLTNLLHLAELAQLASREHPGIDNLLRWLSERNDPPGAERDEQLLRLESDAELVRIVTLHKSKGLEFPLVCLPFPWTNARPLDKQQPVPFHADDGRACLDLGSDAIDHHRDLWLRETLAEGLRLLYVGLTRAKHLCLMHWGAVNQVGTSPGAYLLYPDPALDGPADRMGKRDAAVLRAELEDLLTRAPEAIRIVDALPQHAPTAPVAAAPPVPLSARQFTAAIRSDWRLTSYSGLAGGLERDRPDYDADAGSLLDTQTGPIAQVLDTVEPEAAESADQDQPNGMQGSAGTEAALSGADNSALEQAPIDPVFQFPRGVRAGHCLHEMFEHLDFTSAYGELLGNTVQQTLSRHGIETAWADTAQRLVTQVLDTPLADSDDAPLLRNLPDMDRLNELEFHFPLQQVEPRRLSELIREQGYPDPGIGIEGAPLRGLMKGYIDLVFRYNGRYYLADYKSNHLGDQLEDYARPLLQAAMTAHRYQLQYLIYSVALHRYLRQRIADYDYATHFGGVFYLFVRGMRPHQGADFGVYHDRPEPVLIESLNALLSAASEPAA